MGNSLEENLLGNKEYRLPNQRWHLNHTAPLEWLSRACEGVPLYWKPLPPYKQAWNFTSWATPHPSPGVLQTSITKSSSSRNLFLQKAILCSWVRQDQALDVTWSATSFHSSVLTCAAPAVAWLVLSFEASMKKGQDSSTVLGVPRET